MILPHGVLFRGNAEGTIRESLLKRGLIEGVIGLPANLFYGTGIPACVVVLDKGGAAADRDGVFLVDASRGFRKDGPKNRLREQDIHRVVDTYHERRDVPGYARRVPLAEIVANDYNLNLPRYVDGSGARGLARPGGPPQRGGIPDRDLDGLSAYWDVMPGLRAALVRDRAPRLQPPARARLQTSRTPSWATPSSRRSPTACGPDVRRRGATPTGPACWALDVGAQPARDHRRALGGPAWRGSRGRRSLDPYDLYQHLMDFWAETMQDDVYLVAQDGWRDAAQPRTLVPRRKGQKSLDETPDLVVGKRKVKPWTWCRPRSWWPGTSRPSGRRWTRWRRRPRRRARPWTSSWRSTRARTACWKMPAPTRARSRSPV